MAFVAAAVALVVPSAGGAGLLSTGSAEYCDPEIGQDFARWGDSAYYRLAPGGSFDGGPGWALAGGAKVAAGNEPFNLRTGTRSLLLPAGSTATSPTTCFAFGDWHARFVVRNTGSTSAQLEVDILVRNLLGVLSVVDGGTIRAGEKWAPSPRISALVSNVGGLLGTTNAVSIRLKARGAGAKFQVDDLFLDPFKAR